MYVRGGAAFSGVWAKRKGNRVSCRFPCNSVAYSLWRFDERLLAYARYPVGSGNGMGPAGDGVAAGRGV